MFRPTINWKEQNKFGTKPIVIIYIEYIHTNSIITTITVIIIIIITFIVIITTNII